jgi:hypothetical protein
MDLEEEQHREVYAYFGHAAYWSQCLETTLTNILICDGRIHGTARTAEDVDALETSLQKLPLGPLIKRVSERVQFTSGTEELIKRALSKRNFLMHRFFRERAWEFATVEGRHRMLDELREIQAWLCSADKAAHALQMALVSVLGITPELLEAEFQEMKRKATA